LTVGRHLDWDGCRNARDLGGIRTADGPQTRRGAVVRSDTLDNLTPAGWSALRAHGIRPFMERKPDRCVAAVAAVADARPGGVLVHCSIGRDRTGLVTMLLLALVGVAPDDIAADYELSADRPPPPGAGAGGNGRRWSPQEALARRNTTARAVLLATLEAVDVEAYLRAGGLRDDQVAAVRARLLEPAGGLQLEQGGS
jgi:protein-tyrosine phosphatase